MRSSRVTAAPGAVRSTLLVVLFVAASAAAAAGDDRVPRFADYPASAVFHGMPAAPDFKRNPAAEPFAMELRDGARRGPNFAAYLRVVEWSCGTSCRRWMIVNSKTGRIHDSPEPAFSLEYQLNSLLLVVNTVGRFTAADPPAGVPIAKYYVWRNGRLELIDTRAMRDGRRSPSR